MKKRIIGDSSSLILLQKAKLLETVCRLYTVIVSASVFSELTSHSKEGGRELKRSLTDVRTPSSHRLEGMNMGAGERETLTLYLEGQGDFVLVDDKKAAAYSKKHSIPFINCLLVPRILWCSDHLNEAQCDTLMQKLYSQGYYSAEILARARSMTLSSLRPFMPSE